MAVLIRGLWTFGAVVLTAAVLVIGGGAALTTNQPTVPTLYFMYAMNCTFTIQNDAGATVAQIPPGTYQVDIRTPLAFGTVPLARGHRSDRLPRSSRSSSSPAPESTSSRR